MEGDDVASPAKRPRRVSPTQRSLARLRELGYVAQVVERWNPHARVRQDLFGCIDILAIEPGSKTPILGVQACAAASVSERLKKAIAEPRLMQWIRSGGSFEVWGWSKRGARGKRKVWSVRVVPVALYDDRELAAVDQPQDEVVGPVSLP